MIQYDKARPTYPAEALQAIHDLSKSGPLTILEPGSGTGIFTRLVLSPPDNYPTFDVGSLIGIEPSSGMREAWQKGIDRLPSQAVEGKKVESVDGTFDDFSKAGLGEEQADAVIIAQAFHWCPDYEGALVRHTIITPRCRD
jgi:SAM-dependent methyltransferase